LPGVPAAQNPAFAFCADPFYSGVPGDRARLVLEAIYTLWMPYLYHGVF
jgi:hypothetical protein